MTLEKYRPDIDGLRAVAVLSVILFHLDKNLLPGGFVGVDIFFVISGYLISLHILQDIERKRFSLLEFYRRRVKRIAPAMLVVVAVTLIVTQSIFRPEDAELAAESALWSLASLANVYFWLHQDTSYFAAASNEKPLLHLWSLGVEEQFYLLWPLVLPFLYRARWRGLFAVSCLVMAAGSFILGDILFQWDPSFVYYMLPTRAGELLVGALAAQFVMRFGATDLPASGAQAAAVIGLATVIGSLALLSEDEPFPGWRAIPPTVGTALMIVSGHFNARGLIRLLSIRPLAWVGLISYSAYLWHWPLIAIFRYGRGDVGPLAGAVLFGLTILIAWLTFTYVEKPARQTRRPALQVFVRQYAVPAGALAVAAVVAMKLDGYGLRWFSSDYAARLAAVRDATRPAVDYPYVCQRQRLSPADIETADCVLGGRERPPDALLWGDSNAAHYVGMIGAFAHQAGFSFRNVEVGSCPPLLTDPEEFVPAGRLADCRASMAYSRLATAAAPVIIVSASWSTYGAASSRFLDAFADTVRKLTAEGKRVIIIGKAPIIDTYDRLCWEKALSYPVRSCDAPPVPIAPGVRSVNQHLRDLAIAAPGVEYFDANDYLCPNGQCSALNQTGDPIYFDSSHLTDKASWDLGENILAREGVPQPFASISPRARPSNP